MAAPRNHVARPKRSASIPVFSVRELNRALLARQLLLKRAALPALDAIEHLIGLQSQVPNSPYVGLWTRLEKFRTGELADLIAARQVVRIAMMRSTIHSVSARDCLDLRAVVQPAIDRSLNGAVAKGLQGLDRDAVRAVGHQVFAQRPQLLNAAAAALRKRWKQRESDALAHALRAWLPLVQPPPRGVWGQGGLALHVTAQSWLGEEPGNDASADRLVLRYLAALGPASVQDAQVWSGLTRLRQVFERLRPRLLIAHDHHGKELFDLPQAPRPDPLTPAPVRFLPEYDNVLLAHADRTRIADDIHRAAIYTRNGILPTVLIDGFVGATWRLERNRQHVVLNVRSLIDVSKRQRADVVAEGGRLLALLAADAASSEVVLQP